MTLDNAGFYNLFMGTMYDCGRGSEVTIAKFDDLSMRCIKENNGIRLTGMQQYVLCMNTLGSQDVIHFVAQDTLFEDYVFSFEYYLTLQYYGRSRCIYLTYCDSVIGQDNTSDS